MTTTADTAVAGEHDHSLARKSIGFWSALAMSVEAMGPILGALTVATASYYFIEQLLRAPRNSEHARSAIH